MTAFDRFRAAVLARDPDAAAAEMAEDVRFFNPGSPEPTIGRDAARATFQTLMDVFDALEHAHLLEERAETAGDSRFHAIHFHARVGEERLEGIDLLEILDDVIVSFTVMVRPISGLTAIAQAIHARTQGEQAPDPA